MGVALALFLLSPVTLLAWAAGQALLRVTGLRWWKLALASLAAIAAVIAAQGGPSTGPGPSLLGLCRLAAADRRRHSSTSRPRGRSCGPSSPWPSRSGCWPPRSTWPAAARPSTRPRSSAPSARPPAAWTRPSVAPPAVRDDHFGPVALGVADRRRPGLGRQARPGRRAPADAGPVAADRRHLRAPARPPTSNARPSAPPATAASSSSSTAKAPTPASSSAPWPAICGATLMPGSPCGRSCPWTAGGAPRRHPQPADGHARLVRALLQGRGQPPARAWPSTRPAKTAPSAPPAS